MNSPLSMNSSTPLARHSRFAAICLLGATLALSLGRCGGNDECYNTSVGVECKNEEDASYICDAPVGEYGKYVKGSCPRGTTCTHGICLKSEPSKGDLCSDCGGSFCSGHCSYCSVCF